MGFRSTPFLHKVQRLTGEASLLEEGNGDRPLGYHFPPWANRSSFHLQKGQEVPSTLVPLGLTDWATRGTIGARLFDFANPPELAGVGDRRNAQRKIN